MYPHRRGGFELMWNNIAGDMNLERLREPLSERKVVCIISDSPDTTETRFTIVFLQSFLKMFLQCRRVIIAPSNFLYRKSCPRNGRWTFPSTTWTKNYLPQNKIKVLLVSSTIYPTLQKQIHTLCAWWSWNIRESKSDLGINYDLFRILMEEDEEGYAKETREILLKFLVCWSLKKGTLLGTSTTLCGNRLF